MFAETWASLLGPSVDPAIFQSTFSQGGYYRLRIPSTRNLRLIVLNSSRSVQQDGSAITYWQPELTSRFLQLVVQYQSTTQTAIASHTHMDDFRVIHLNGQPVFLTKIAPAVSPIYGNNPGFQIYQYDRETGMIRNYQTFYLANLTSDGKLTTFADGRWALEYNFHESYGLSNLNPRTAAQLADRIKSEAAVRERYTKYYSVSAAPEISAVTVDVYRCAISNVTPAEFQMCFRGVREPVRPPPLAGRKLPTQPSP
jgi:hypothetical protein